jgi:hypothetical protein
MCDLLPSMSSSNTTKAMPQLHHSTTSVLKY